MNEKKSPNKNNSVDALQMVLSSVVDETVNKLHDLSQLDIKSLGSSQLEHKLEVAFLDNAQESIILTFKKWNANETLVSINPNFQNNHSSPDVWRFAIFGAGVLISFLMFLAFDSSFIAFGLVWFVCLAILFYRDSRIRAKMQSKLKLINVILAKLKEDTEFEVIEN